jgi:ATP-dependent helicase HrpB
VISANLLLALSSDAPGGKQRKAQVRIACRLEPDLLMEMAGEKIEAQDQLLWNSARERLEQVSRLSYGKVTLDESRFWAGPSKAGALLLMKAALAKGPSVYDPDGHLEALTVRLALLCKVLPELVPSFVDGAEPFFGEVFGGGQLQASPLTERALLVACESRTSIEQLAEARLDQELMAHFPSSLSRALEQELPRTVRLRGGMDLPVHYSQGRDPWVESRLQNFFSMGETPTLCRGRLPLQLHLLAPNRRALQVTTDLAGFWVRHYPDLRKQLMRRYPKHLWPEDGRSAKPPEPGKIR